MFVVLWIDHNTIVDKHHDTVQIDTWHLAKANDEFFYEEYIVPVRFYLTAAVVPNTNSSSRLNFSILINDLQ